MARSFGRLVIKALKEVDKAARQAVIDAGKKALERRVQARDKLCKRYIDSVVE
ncbi:hypothetical protein [Granulosicoccus antarcticus]|uniref:Uncharacterized protein n=1 Tax=Granulosicoccus antarcticus IMCC3135 TaxID=1192854 RepID=A0A2Z2NTN2_9GAMM|nr:hypothetical protein [Granulosicoccus antarcticus]ASJ73411.1 hypothetical protein IMCC3135_16645 [Granulosicoccus antarcticus IMCC3135]